MRSFTLSLTPLLCLALAGLLTSPLRAQGTLTPPGAPAPTMKSLDQLSAEIGQVRAEARTPLTPATTPGDTTSVFIITQPGAYYLTSDVIAPAGKIGIRLNITSFGSGGVSIDLNGFSVIGPGVGAAPATNGINAPSANFSVVVHGGQLRDWPGTSVFIGGIGQLRDLVVTQGGGPGLVVNGGIAPFGGASSTQVAQVVRCMVQGVRGTGIQATNGLAEACVVAGVVSTAASASATGISAAQVRDCVVRAVEAQAGNAVGISADALIIRSTVNDVTGSGSVTGLRAPAVQAARYAQSVAPLAASGDHAGILAHTVSSCQVQGLQANTSGTVAAIRAIDVRACVVERIANSGTGAVAGLRAHQAANSATGAGVATALWAEGNLVSGIGGVGISGGGGAAQILQNLVRGTTGDGIGEVAVGLVADNQVTLPAGAAGDGIEVASATVRGNHVSHLGTGVGLRLTTGGLATANLVEGSATAFSFVAAARTGPIVTGGGATAFDPLANVDL
jgi:hypothetical protein